MSKKPLIRIALVITVVAGLLVVGAWFVLNGWPSNPPGFDGQRAYQDVIHQVALGPRVPATAGHARIVTWIQDELEAAGWGTEVQQGDLLGHPIKNIIARRGTAGPWIILGAHYDTRMFADQDPDPAKTSQPVPGANDGASGVAVLLELARVLPPDLPAQVWLVFFDAEDNGNIPTWDWILGSRLFVERLTGSPEAVIIVDMVGDADLNLHLERNSDPRLSTEIWEQAAALGYEDVFIATPKHSMLDDHTPFLQAGIPAVDIIDFDYAYWHTTHDTPDKVSPESLEAVGETLLVWLLEKAGQ